MKIFKINLIVFILLLFINANMVCFAQSAQDIQLSKIETSIWGFDYQKDDVQKRLSRIENNVFGQASSNLSLDKRIQKLNEALGFESYEDSKKQAYEIDDTEVAGVNYPQIDALEYQMFNTTYEKENIYKRLDRLEEKVFNSKSTAPLNERVNKLASVISPMKNTGKNMNSYSYSSDDLNEYYARSGLETVNEQSIPFQLAVLEQELLKNNYNNDNIANRLTRLEQKLFKRTFQSDNDISRLQRIMVAYDAKKNSYKYENNRKMQNFATFSQIGGILLMILAILL